MAEKEYKVTDIFPADLPDFTQQGKYKIPRTNAEIAEIVNLNINKAQEIVGKYQDPVDRADKLKTYLVYIKALEQFLQENKTKPTDLYTQALSTYTSNATNFKAITDKIEADPSIDIEAKSYTSPRFAISTAFDKTIANTSTIITTPLERLIKNWRPLRYKYYEFYANPENQKEFTELIDTMKEHELTQRIEKDTEDRAIMGIMQILVQSSSDENMKKKAVDMLNQAMGEKVKIGPRKDEEVKTGTTEKPKEGGAGENYNVFSKDDNKRLIAILAEKITKEPVLDELAKLVTQELITKVTELFNTGAAPESAVPEDEIKRMLENVVTKLPELTKEEQDEVLEVLHGLLEKVVEEIPKSEQILSFDNPLSGTETEPEILRRAPTPALLPEMQRISSTQRQYEASTSGTSLPAPPSGIPGQLPPTIDLQSLNTQDKIIEVLQKIQKDGNMQYIINNISKRKYKEAIKELGKLPKTSQENNNAIQQIIIALEKLQDEQTYVEPLSGQPPINPLTPTGQPAVEVLTGSDINTINSTIFTIKTNLQTLKKNIPPQFHNNIAALETYNIQEIQKLLKSILNDTSIQPNIRDTITAQKKSIDTLDDMLKTKLDKMIAETKEVLSYIDNLKIPESEKTQETLNKLIKVLEILKTNTNNDLLSAAITAFTEVTNIKKEIKGIQSRMRGVPETPSTENSKGFVVINDKFTTDRISSDYIQDYIYDINNKIWYEKSKTGEVVYNLKTPPPLDKLNSVTQNNIILQNLVIQKTLYDVLNTLYEDKVNYKFKQEYAKFITENSIALLVTIGTRRFVFYIDTKVPSTGVIRVNEIFTEQDKGFYNKLKDLIDFVNKENVNLTLTELNTKLSTLTELNKKHIFLAFFASTIGKVSISIKKNFYILEKIYYPIFIGYLSAMLPTDEDRVYYNIVKKSIINYIKTNKVKNKETVFDFYKNNEVQFKKILDEGIKKVSKLEKYYLLDYLSPSATEYSSYNEPGSETAINPSIKTLTEINNIIQSAPGDSIEYLVSLFYEKNPLTSIGGAPPPNPQQPNPTPPPNPTDDIAALKTNLKKLSAIKQQYEEFKTLWNSYKNSTPRKEFKDLRVGILLEELLKELGKTSYNSIQSVEESQRNIDTIKSQNIFNIYDITSTTLRTEADKYLKQEREKFNTKLSELYNSVLTLNAKETIIQNTDTLNKLNDLIKTINPDGYFTTKPSDSLEKYFVAIQTNYKLNVAAVNTYILGIKNDYNKIPGYSVDEIIGRNKYYQDNSDKVKKAISEKSNALIKDLETLLNDMTSLSKRYAPVSQIIKKRVYEIFEPSKGEESKITIINDLKNVSSLMKADIETQKSLFQTQAAGITRDKNSNQRGGADEAENKDFAPIDKDLAKIETTLINTDTDTSLSKLLKTFLNSLERSSDPTLSLTTPQGDSIFNTLFKNYLESKEDVNKGNFIAANELAEGLKVNDINPRDVLDINNQDKVIFIFVTLFFRLIALTIIDYLIDKSKLKQIHVAFGAYIGIYIGIFYLFLLIVNLDSYKLRIMFNYVNMHSNSSVALVHPAMVGLFGLIIYYIMWNINGKTSTTASNDEDRVRLKYKMQVISLIVWMVLAILIFLM